MRTIQSARLAMRRHFMELHPDAAAAARVNETRLADWFFGFHFSTGCDFFELDPVAYAPALGECGMKRVREKVDALRAAVPVDD